MSATRYTFRGNTTGTPRSSEDLLTDFLEQQDIRTFETLDEAKAFAEKLGMPSPDFVAIKMEVMP